MSLAHYDFVKYNHYDGWGPQAKKMGALNITHHRLCNLFEIQGTFSKLMYDGRLERRRSFYDELGRLKQLPPMSRHEIMMMDMDIILSCVNSAKDGSHHTIILHTNDTEDKDWLNFLERCPYARKMWSIPSKMGPYMVHEWIISKENYRAV
jgi:hypothetical protein